MKDKESQIKEALDRGDLSLQELINLYVEVNESLKEAKLTITYLEHENRLLRVKAIK